MLEKINQLSKLAGILPDYYDIWGNRHEATEATKRALLLATGTLDENTPDIDSALLRSENAIWDECLPPVHICLIDQPIALICRLPESASDQTHAWHITLENGDELEGDFSPANLEQTSRHADSNEVLIAVSLILPALSEMGYHRLEISLAGKVLANCALTLCPPAVYSPPVFADGNRIWGLSLQLYGLRTLSNWGLGDFADLLPALDWAAESGASLIGLNPLHALFPHNPQHCSPYSPSSRQFINVLDINVEATPEFLECKEAQKYVSTKKFRSTLAALKQSDLVDYTGVAEAKFTVLEILYKHFRHWHLKKKTAHAQAFLAFLDQGGDDLRLFALYNALQEHFYAQDSVLWGWPVWPLAYQSHASSEVMSFAHDHADRVEWHLWLQWQADEQLKAACLHADECGLSIGLYQDLAVGVDKGGAETWIHRDLYALDCRIGCPPDDFNLLGQDWGLPPWIPHKLRAAAYRPYIAMLRANMKYAGALRIDHVMGLMRLYWIPPDMKGDAGAYLTYPFRDLLAIMALESHRSQCVIVGEDLGTVPDEARHALHELGVLTYRLFYFERQQDGHFMPPGWYPEQALVSASTHDLPTLAGFWKGRDIAARTELHQFPSDEVRNNQIAERREDKARLLDDLVREGLLPEGISNNPDDLPELTPALLHAVLRYIARTPAKIALIQAEDMLGLEEQANLPGTVDEHPNWRRKLPLELEQWLGDENCRAACAAMAQERTLR